MSRYAKLHVQKTKVLAMFSYPNMILVKVYSILYFVCKYIIKSDRNKLDKEALSIHLLQGSYHVINSWYNFVNNCILNRTQNSPNSLQCKWQNFHHILLKNLILCFSRLMESSLTSNFFSISTFFTRTSNFITLRKNKLFDIMETW